MGSTLTETYLIILKGAAIIAGALIALALLFIAAVAALYYATEVLAYFIPALREPIVFKCSP